MTTGDSSHGPGAETSGAAEVLRVYVGEADRHAGGRGGGGGGGGGGSRPLYEAIVLEARAAGMAGATVVRGVMGYGRDSRLHTAKVLRIAEDLPMVIEIVDSPERVAAFVPVLRSVAPHAVVTLERVRLVPTA